MFSRPSATPSSDATSEPNLSSSRRQRDKYSRLICLGCSERRIRCELPSSVDGIENIVLGEVRITQTGCYRCKRLRIPCVVRKTILGRPGRNDTGRGQASSDRANVSRSQPGGLFLPIAAGIPSSTLVCTQLAPAQTLTISEDESVHLVSDALEGLPPDRRDSIPLEQGSSLTRVPQSAETVLIARAIDTLRCQHVEDEWYRHLVAHIGHAHTLDLSIVAMVAACAYSRRVPSVTLEHCYTSLSQAINGLHADIERSQQEPNDHLLASAALLAPFEGIIAHHGIPTRRHVRGLAAIIAARPVTYSVTRLARDILDYYAYESAVISYVHDTPSDFESVDQAYVATSSLACRSDRDRLKALNNDLFIRMPRLAKLVRTLHLQSPPQRQLLCKALRLSEKLLGVPNHQAGGRLLQTIDVRPSRDPASPTLQSLHFSCVQDFEALVGYWYSGLTLLRLVRRLKDLITCKGADREDTDPTRPVGQSALVASHHEMTRLAKNILMCSEYAATLTLRRHTHLFVHAMLTVWGVTKAILTGPEIADNGGSPGVSSELLLCRLNEAFSVKPGLRVEDLDDAADLFAGAQPSGRFAKLYGLESK